MSGQNFGFLYEAATHPLQSPEERGSSADDTYRGPYPERVGEALRQVMWAFDGLRCTLEERLATYRDEAPRLRRLDGVLIWLASSVLTAVSLLVALRVIG